MLGVSSSFPIEVSLAAVESISYLESSTSSTTVLSGGVRRNWGNVLNSANVEFTTSGKGSDGALGTRAKGLGLNTTSGSQLDVNTVDADLLQFDGDLLGGNHGSVWGALFLIRVHLHSTGDLAVGFASGEIGDVNEGVVPGGQDVSDGKDLL